MLLSVPPPGSSGLAGAREGPGEPAGRWEDRQTRAAQSFGLAQCD